MQMPGALKQPENTQGAVWSPVPSSVCTKAYSTPLPASGTVLHTSVLPSLPLPQFPHLIACQGFQGGLCPEQQCQQRTQQSQTGSRAELGQGQRRQLSVHTLLRLTRACFPFWQETSWTRRCPGLSGTSGLLVDGFRLSQWELVSCLQPSCGWQMGGTLSRLTAPIQTRDTQLVLGHAPTMGCSFGQKVPTQPWGTHPVTGYPPPRAVQGKWWEWGVPADTWGRKDLLWGWDKAKLKKRGSP